MEEGGHQKRKWARHQQRPYMISHDTNRDSNQSDHSVTTPSPRLFANAGTSAGASPRDTMGDCAISYGDMYCFGCGSRFSRARGIPPAGLGGTWAGRREGK